MIQALYSNNIFLETLTSNEFDSYNIFMSYSVNIFIRYDLF